MRRWIPLLIILFIFCSYYFANNTEIESDIPSDAVRLRIIPNSDREEDQEVKEQIRDKVIQYLTPKLETTASYEEARLMIYQNLDAIETIVVETLTDHDMNIESYVDYGITYFPTKVYGDKMYQAGEYEAVYIVLGKGEGSNWWCVLFPPLCLMDSSLSINDLDDFKEVEYKFYFYEKLKQIFSNK